MDPSLCANGCGFFGTSSTRNLCSKCYRDLHKEEELGANLCAKLSISTIEKPLMNPKTAESSLSENNINSDNVASVAGPKRRTCQSCNKRVGLLGFDCRCGGVFCGAHRYAEEHSCSFDFKAFGRETLAKANLLCKGDKLKEKI